MTKQKVFTEDDFDWNHDVDMPNRIANTLSPDQALKIKQLRALVKAKVATPEQVAEYTRIMMSYT